MNDGINIWSSFSYFLNLWLQSLEMELLYLCVFQILLFYSMLFHIELKEQQHSMRSVTE